jgi:hypothetical protein
VALSWSAVAGAASYNVYRGTSPGGEGAVPYQAGLTGTTFTDVNAAGGTTYYYQVSAVNLGGEGARSAEQSATSQSLPPYRVLGIDAGGGAAGTYVADTDFVGGSTFSTGAVIDTSGVFQPAPQAVYQTMRYSATPGFAYAIAGLTPGASYTLRLHFVEPTFASAGSRVFNVTLNGAPFLSNFDIFVAAGAVNRAVAEVGTATADAAGKITVGFGLVTNAPLIAAVEVFAAAPVQSPPAPANVTATASVGQVALTWSAVAGATSYNVYRGTSPGGEGAAPYQTGLTGTTFTDVNFTGGTTYYYQVSAVNLGGEGVRSSEQSVVAQGLPPYSIVAIDAGGGASGAYVADTDFVGGNTFSTGAAIDTSGVFQPAPQAVYQTMRYSATPGFAYVIPGLTPGASYTVRLEFVEPTFASAGSRVFNVTLNGAAFLSNFDIFAAAGAVNKAVAEVGTATADATGQITIGFGLVTNAPLIAAVEILSSTPPPGHLQSLVAVMPGSNASSTVSSVPLTGTSHASQQVEAGMLGRRAGRRPNGHPRAGKHTRPAGRP